MFHIAFIWGHPLYKVNEIISELDVFIIWDRIFLCVDDEDDLFGLSIFFSAGYGLLRGNSQEYQYCLQSLRSLITSLRYLPDLLGALVKSWSPSHCFIMKSLITMSKKGTETSPPGRNLVTSNSLVRWLSTYTALLKLVYRAIAVSTYGYQSYQRWTLNSRFLLWQFSCLLHVLVVRPLTSSTLLKLENVRRGIVDWNLVPPPCKNHASRLFGRKKSGSGFTEKERCEMQPCPAF